MSYLNMYIIFKKQIQIIGILIFMSWGVLQTLQCPWDFFLRFYLFIFREGKGEIEGEKHRCVVASHRSPTGDLVGNQESNWWPFGLQASAQSTEPHQPGQDV